MSLHLDEFAQNLLFRRARTANNFTNDPVSDAQIQAIYDLVKWAPTSFNQQPLRVVLVRSREERSILAGFMEGKNQQKTRSAPLTAILAADSEFHENLAIQYPVLPHAKHLLFSDDTVRLESAFLNATLQIGYFILGVRAAGLAAGPMSGFDADRVAKHFFPGNRQRALVVMNIGKPGPHAWYERLPRLSYQDVFRTI